MHISEILPKVNAQIETKAQQTTVEPVNTMEWEKWFDFQTFGDPELLKMLHAGARYVQAMRAKVNPNWLSLVGTCGTGKTHIARKIWSWYARCELSNAEVLPTKEIIYPGQFCKWPMFAEKLRSGEGYGRLDDMMAEKFVVLDDIGIERDSTGFVTEKLSILMSARVGKWTLVTSNLSLRHIAEKLDARIASRMLRDESVIVDVETKDFNLRRRQSDNIKS